MTIQQGTTPYIYPYTDNVMPVVISVFGAVAALYKDRAWVRSCRAPNTYFGEKPWIEPDVTVLELNDRYVGYAPYLGAAYPISSEANASVKEGYPLIWQESQKAKLRIKDTDYQDTIGLGLLLRAYSLGHDGVEAVDKVTSQSVVEHYLFGTTPVLTRTQDAKRLDVNSPVVDPSPAIAAFVALMARYKGQSYPLGYLYSAKAGMTCTIYSKFPVIPKLETENWHVDGTIDGLVAHYHGLFMAQLSASQKADYVAGNWAARIRNLVTSAVWCQYFWSYRCKLNFTLS